MSVGSSVVEAATVFISAAGFYANGGLVAAVARLPRLRSTDGLYVAAAAVLNMALCVLHALTPAVGVRGIIGPDDFAGCTCFWAAVFWVTDATVLTLLMATVKCYVSITFPIFYSVRWTQALTVWTVVGAWAFAATVTVLSLAVKGMRDVWDSLNIEGACLPKYVVEFKLNTFFSVVLVRLVPLCLAVFMYVAIFMVVRRKTKERAQRLKSNVSAPDRENVEKERSENQAHISAAKRFALIVSVFIVSFVPFEILNSLQGWGVWDCGQVCKRSVGLIKILKPLVDSFIYTYHNTAMKDAMINMMTCNKCCRTKATTVKKYSSTGSSRTGSTSVKGADSSNCKEGDTASVRNNRHCTSGENITAVGVAKEFTAIAKDDVPDFAPK